MNNPYIKKLIQKELTCKEFLVLGGLAAASLFGAFGVITELLSHAATPYASGEAEDGTKTGAASLTSNSTDSEGEAVQFGTATGSYVLLSSSIPIQATVSVTAPSSAAYASVQFQPGQSATAGDILYMAKLGVFAGSTIPTWSAPNN
jgi:hypothetical protein